MSDDGNRSQLLDLAGLADSVASYGIGPAHLLGGPVDATPGFIARRETRMNEWWLELVERIKEQHGRLATIEQEQLRARLQEDEAIGILANYVRQAEEEPLAERRRMLQCAAAALANLRLGVAELARVQRILRELEPDDLVILYGLWLAKGEPTDASVGGNRRARFILAMWVDSGAESLETAGCVRVRAAGGGAGVGTHEEMEITATGRLVLRSLRSYISARNVDTSTIPGHEVTPDFRREEEAREMIAAVPGLLEAARAARGIGFGPIQYTSFSPRQGLPANGKTQLIIRLPPETAKALQRATEREVAEFGRPVSRIFVDVISPSNAEGGVDVQICGPHDILRWLAYDLDAWWS